MATILKWVGATTGGFINMTFPCIFYLSTHREEKLTFKRFFVYLINVFSITFSFLTVIVFIYRDIYS